MTGTENFDKCVEVTGDYVSSSLIFMLSLPVLVSPCLIRSSLLWKF